MAVVSFQIGAEVDVLSNAELTAGLDGIYNKLKPEPKPKAKYFPLMKQGNSSNSSTTPFILDLGDPPPGRYWDILGITTCGVDDFTTVSGKVAIYCGDVVNPSLIALKVPAITIPSYTSLSDDDPISCMPGNNIYANVSGVANSTYVTVIVHVAEWRMEDKLQRVGI